MFFAISGYLITGLLVREVEKTGRIDLLRFYARRARRLLPSATLVLISVIVAGAILLPPLGQKQVAESALATSLFSVNEWFIRQRMSYFGRVDNLDPFLNAWSLAVEEQFYLFWPGIIAIAMWMGSRLMLRRALCLGALLSFGGSVWLSQGHYPYAFFSLLARAWELGVGGIILLIGPTRPNGLERWRPFAGWLGLTSIIACAVLMPADLPYPALAGLIPVCGTAAILAAGESPTGAIRALQHNFIRWIGRLSYSWYLWSWPLLAIVRSVYPWLPIYGEVLCAGGSLGLAALTYRLVENPVRMSRRLNLRPRLSLLFAATAMTGCALTALRWKHSALLGSPAQLALSASVSAPALVTEGCMAGPKDVDLRECVRTNPDSPLTVVLFGDSHAAQWSPALERIALDRNWRFITLVKSGCPAALIAVKSPFGGPVYVECQTWRHKAIRRIISLRPAVVIIGNSARYVRSENWNTSHSTLSAEEWEKGLHRTLQLLTTTGIETILLRDTPWPGVDIPLCLSGVLQRGPLRKEVCAFSETQALDTPIFQAEKRAANGLEGATVVDFSDLFCSAGICAAFDQGLPVYRDSRYLNAPYAESLSARIAQRLVPLMKPR